jgi:hypothetical protein
MGINYYSPSAWRGRTRKEDKQKKAIIICNSWAWLPNMASNRFQFCFQTYFAATLEILILPTSDYAFFSDLPNTSRYSTFSSVSLMLKTYSIYAYIDKDFNIHTTNKTFHNKSMAEGKDYTKFQRE